jgi:hypothetical protein
MTFLRELLSRRRTNRLTEIQRRLDELPTSIAMAQRMASLGCEMGLSLAPRHYMHLYSRLTLEQARLEKEQHKLRRKMV